MNILLCLCILICICIYIFFLRKGTKDLFSWVGLPSMFAMLTQRPWQGPSWSQQQPNAHSGDRLSRQRIRRKASGREKGLEGNIGSSPSPFIQFSPATMPAQSASGSASPALGFMVYYRLVYHHLV